MRVAQVLPNFHERDAVGDNTILWHDVLTGLGYESAIFAIGIEDSVSTLARGIDELSGYKPDVIVYHYSTYSDITKQVINFPCKKRVIIYHNVTPAEYFRGFSQVHFDYCNRAREDLNRLSSSFDMALADSDYNAAELIEMGFQNVQTLRLSAPVPGGEHVKEKTPLSRYLVSGDTLDVLYVGRICPNKGILNLVLAFHYIKSFITKNARLLLIGSSEGFETYRAMLDDVIDEHGIGDVYFLGSVPDDIRDAAYELADVFVTASEHEGFCVPILEAWRAGLPIVSSDSSALPETIGDAGVIVPVGKPGIMAEAIREVYENSALRYEMVQRGHNRYKLFGVQQFTSNVRKVMGGLVND